MMNKTKLTVGASIAVVAVGGMLAMGLSVEAIAEVVKIDDSTIQVSEQVVKNVKLKALRERRDFVKAEKERSIAMCEQNRLNYNTELIELNTLIQQAKDLGVE